METPKPSAPSQAADDPRRSTAAIGHHPPRSQQRPADQPEQQGLVNTERDNLTAEASSLSREVDSYLVDARRQLAQLGNGILMAPGPDDVGPGSPSPG